MRIKDLMGAEERKFWDDFSENIEMVIGYDAAINSCLNFIIKHGLPNCNIFDLDGKEMSINVLLEQMLNYFKANEEYEKCVKITASYVADSKCNITEFINNAKIVVGFEDNCKVCWMIFKTYEMIPFYSMARVQDYIKLMTVLINYFHDRKEFEKCILIKSLRDEVISEMTSKNPLPYFQLNS